MQGTYIIDLYTDFEDRSYEALRKRTQEVIHRYNLSFFNPNEAFIYLVVSFSESKGNHTLARWRASRSNSFTTGRIYLENRKQEYPELKINFEETFIGEI